MLGLLFFAALMQPDCAALRLPPLSDLDNFPPADQVGAELSWHWQCRRQVDFRLTFAGGEDAELTRTLQDYQQLYVAWDALRDAQTGPLEESGQNQSWCRSRLADLRDLIGPAAYCQGRMPPSVPLWRFQRIGD